MTRMGRGLGAAAPAIFAALILAGCGERGEGKAGGSTGALYHYRLAAEKYREGDFDAAIGIYEKSLQMNPKLAEAHLDLGIIYDDYKGAKEKAVEQYRAFLSLEPRSAKAEMVRRWIVRATEEKGAPAVEEGEGAPTGQGEPAPAARAGQDRAREDLAILRAENEAYLKTVEALRNELTQARAEIAALHAPGAAGTPAAPESPFTSRPAAAGWEAEKARLWEQYRAEKAGFDRTVDSLKEEIAHLQAQKAASDDALREARAKPEGAGKAAPAGGAAAGDRAGRELEAAQERIREFEKRGASGQRERDAILAKLKDAEKRLQGYRMQASSDSPLLLAKVKADAEREREDLKKKYEKRLSEAAAGYARERTELQKELAETRRAATEAPPPAPVPERPQAAARIRADADREKAELKQYYEKKLADAAASSGREKTEMQKELSEARRESAYLKEQYEKSRQTAGKTEQYSAGAMERMREQFRREKAEMEDQYRREREQLLARLTAQRMKAPAAAPGRPAAAPARSAPAAPAAPARSAAAAKQPVPSRPAATAPAARRPPAPAAPQWVEPGARKPSAAAKPPAAARRYRTVKGDTLRSIATRFYGTPGRWKGIYDANIDTLRGRGGSSALTPGWILIIP